MTEYGVMHRCRWLVRPFGPGRQCTRRGRWLSNGLWWLCHQHYVCAHGMDGVALARKIAMGEWVQERLLP